MGCMDKDEGSSRFLDDAIHWKLEDQKEKSIEKARKICDEIEPEVKELISRLEKNS